MECWLRMPHGHAGGGAGPGGAGGLARLGRRKGPAGLEIWRGWGGGRGRRTSGDRRWNRGGHLGGCGSEDEDNRNCVRAVKEIKRREKSDIVK